MPDFDPETLSVEERLALIDRPVAESSPRTRSKGFRQRSRPLWI